MNEKHATSGKDGKLVFQNRRLALRPDFRKVGFIDSKLEFDEIRPGMRKPEGFVVVMEPSIDADRCGLSRPNGTPVNAFTVAAGPGKLPSGSASVWLEVQGRDGRCQPGSLEEGHDVGGRRRPWVRGMGRLGRR